jgi:hypothetical protein
MFVLTYLVPWPGVFSASNCLLCAGDYAVAGMPNLPAGLQ